MDEECENKLNTQMNDKETTTEDQPSKTDKMSPKDTPDKMWQNHQHQVIY